MCWKQVLMLTFETTAKSNNPSDSTTGQNWVNFLFLKGLLNVRQVWHMRQPHAKKRNNTRHSNVVFRYFHQASRPRSATEDVLSNPLLSLWKSKLVIQALNKHKTILGLILKTRRCKENPNLSNLFAPHLRSQDPVETKPPNQCLKSKSFSVSVDSSVLTISDVQNKSKYRNFVLQQTTFCVLWVLPILTL